MIRILLQLLGALTVATALIGCGSSSNTTGAVVVSTASTASTASSGPRASAGAVQLAEYQSNATASATDPLALRFDTLLKALKPLCRESSYKVAAESWASWKDLQKNHINVSLLHVVQALKKAGSGVPASGRPTNCGALLAAYLVLVEPGNGKP